MTARSTDQVSLEMNLFKSSANRSLEIGASPTQDDSSLGTRRATAIPCSPAIA